MKRRDFLKTGSIVAGLAGAPSLIVPLVAEEKESVPLNICGARMPVNICPSHRRKWNRRDSPA